MPPKHKVKAAPRPKLPAVQKSEQEDSPLNTFNLELRWCIQKLELSLEKKKGSREVEDMAKGHKTLTSSKASLVKKRQVMHSLFGDYRAKMELEEKKAKFVQPKVNDTCSAPSKSVFLKASVHQKCYKNPKATEILGEPSSSTNSSKDDTRTADGAEVSNCEDAKQSSDKKSSISEDVCSSVLAQSVSEIKGERKAKSKFIFMPSDNSFKFNYVT